LEEGKLIEMDHIVIEFPSIGPPQQSGTAHIGTYRQISADIGTYRRISANIGMSVPGGMCRSTLLGGASYDYVKKNFF